MGHSCTAGSSRPQGVDVVVEAREDGRMPPPLHHRHQGRTEDHPHVVRADDYCCCCYAGGGV
jgi:hypothetical protein